MPPITRKGDKSTGHDLCPAVEAVSGESRFLVNGRPIVLVGDKYAPHGCDAHAVHQGTLAGGSSAFLVNGRQVGRVGDPISCGGTVAEGSGNFIVGNGNEQKRNETLCRRNETVTRYTRSRDDDIFYCLPLIAEAVGNRQNERDRQGWHYLRDMFYKWLAGEANDNPQNNPSPFWVDIDWVLSYFPDTFLSEIFPNAAKNQRAINSLNNILRREGFFVKQNIEFNFLDISWQMWETYYYQRVDIEEHQLVGSGIIAALETFTFRFLPKGKIEYLENNQYKITLEQIAVFVYDVFNFSEDDNMFGLGFWSCENKNISSVPLPGYIQMTNYRFNNFRSQTNCGNDFKVLSRPKIIDNFDKYIYNYMYE